MDILYFNNFDNLTNNIVNEYQELKDEFDSVGVIAKYEEARNIIKNLIERGFDIGNVELCDEEYNRYDKEYLISIFDEEIYCEPLFVDESYLSSFNEVLYVMDNCSSKVLDSCDYDKAYEVCMNENSRNKSYDCHDSCNECCADCDCCDEEYDEYDDEYDDEMHGFTVSKNDETGYKSYSFYSTEYIDEENIVRILEKLNF